MCIVYPSLALNLTCHFVARSLGVELFLPTLQPLWITDNWKCYLCYHCTFFPGNLWVCQTAQFPVALADCLPLLKESDICCDPFLTSLIINFYPHEGPSPLSYDSLVFQKCPVRSFLEHIFGSLGRLSKLDCCSTCLFIPLEKSVSQSCEADSSSMCGDSPSIKQFCLLNNSVCYFLLTYLEYLP